MDQVARARQLVRDLAESTDSSRSPLPVRSSLSTFQPWSQKAYLQRLFGFTTPRWTSRRKECESVAAALHGWSLCGLDILCCEICQTRVHQPWIQNMNTDLEAETAAQYANELAEKHSADCPWRTAWCPGKLQYYQLQFTNEELNVLMQRASELEQLGSADIQSPKDLDGIPLPMGLAICGWKHEGYNHLECIFNCSEKVAVDALFHPLFDHRWCCPVVNLNTNSAEPTGWKAMLQLYNLKKKTTGTPSTPGFGSPATPTGAAGFGAPQTPAAPSFQFGAIPATPATPATPSTSFGFCGVAATPAAAAPATNLGTFGAPSSTATPATGTSSFSFGGLPSTTSTLSTAGPTSLSSLKPSNQFFSSSVPAQTATGMPYPKDTKYADLPADIQKAIESLESTIRGYESASFQVSNRRYEKVESCAEATEELEKKLQVFEFAIQKNQNRMVAAKRNLGKYWKYGETVSRHIASIKPAAPGQQPAQVLAVEATEDLILASDLRFLEAIITDFEIRSDELKSLTANINSLLDHLQNQPNFSVKSLKSTIRSHADTLLSLAERLACFQDDIQQLRNSYRQFCLLYRHDSRDPFAPKYVAPPATEPPPSQSEKPAPVVAPKITSLLGQPAQPPTPSFGGFSLPSANSFFK